MSLNNIVTNTDIENEETESSKRKKPRLSSQTTLETTDPSDVASVLSSQTLPYVEDDPLGILSEENSGATIQYHDEASSDLEELQVAGLSALTVPDIERVSSDVIRNSEGCSKSDNQQQHSKNLDNDNKIPVPDPVADLKKISSLIRDAKIISSLVPGANYNVIYNELLEHRSKDDRLDTVASNLLEGNLTSNSASASARPARSVSDDLKAIMDQHPSAEADLVQACLESLKHDPLRYFKTLKEMGLPSQACDHSSNNSKQKSIENDSTFIVDDPVFNDMKTIAKVFPGVDRNEIYALLEANINHDDRIHRVTNELLHRVQMKNTDEPSSNQAETIDLTEKTDPDVQFEEEVENLRILFPDCDPDYIYEKLTSMKDKADKQMVLAAELVDKKDYPKLKDRLERERKIDQQKKAIQRTFTPEEFFEKFPEPQKTFESIKKPISPGYRLHAITNTINSFPMLRKDFLMKRLKENHFHYYVTFKKLNDYVLSVPIAKRRTEPAFMKNVRKTTEPELKENDEFFFHELWFTHNELKFKDHFEQKKLAAQRRLEEAREKGELYECPCCCEDELLFEDLTSCPEGHLFCKVCVVRSTEAAFGEMKTEFPCLSGDCDQKMPLSQLQKILPSKLFSKILSRKQEEEVLQAEILDLVTCPFCPFATIMPNPDDKVLKCLNPECLKDSCRLCKEESHIPLRCDEIESRAGTSMRTFIENKIAEAVMRKCHRCGKKFLKDTGCNKMTCVCKATSCYNCKAQDIDYNHFNNNKKCAETSPNIIHLRDMKEAAQLAFQEYVASHPEAANIDLDPELKKLIQPDNKRSEEPQQKSENNEVNREEDQNSTSSQDEDEESSSSMDEDLDAEDDYDDEFFHEDDYEEMNYDDTEQWDDDDFGDEEFLGFV